MARIEKVVNVKVNTKEAVSETEKLTNAIESLAKSQEEANEQAKKTAEDAKKKLEEQRIATEKARKPLNRLKAGFKGLGTAIKATGIGLLISALAGLTAAANSNTVISNKLKEVWQTISLVFGDFVTALVSAVQEVGKANGEFDSLKKVVSSIITGGLTPLKIILGTLKQSFFSIKQVINQLQLAWEKSWLGGKGKDKERIKELEGAIIETRESIKKTGESIVKAGKDGFNAFKTYAVNVGGAISDVAKITAKSVEKVSKISIENSKKLAEQLVKQRGETRLAIANNELILKTKQKEAELQRQIRDDIELDLKTRVEANNKLEEILKEGNKLQLANAQKAIDLANLEVQASGGSIDAKEQLIRAELAYQDVLETTDGFLSEQKTNRASLNLETIELEQTALDAQKERQLDQLEFEAEQEENEANKIIKLQERLDLEKQKLEEDLERKRKLFKEGTQARVDAEQEYLTAKKKLDQKQKQLDNKSADESEKREKAVASAKIGIAKNTLSLIQAVAGEGSRVGKALAVAQTTISTIEGVQNAFTTAAKSPITTVFPAYPFVQAGTAGAFGALQIQKILSTSDSGSSSGGGSPSSASGQSAPQVTAPSFNLVSGTGTDQIADTIQNQDRPIKAFVVSNDVTTGQELDRNAVEGATL